MAFEAMVCLSAACAVLTLLQLCPVKLSLEAALQAACLSAVSAIHQQHQSPVLLGLNIDGDDVCHKDTLTAAVRQGMHHICLNDCLGDEL